MTKTTKERGGPNKPSARIKKEDLPGHEPMQMQDQDTEGKKKKPCVKAQDLPRELRHNDK